MKRFVAILLCAMLALLAGCDTVSEITGAVTDAFSGPSGEEMYSKLDSLISNPSGSTDLSGSFTFVAAILSEPEEMTFDDDDTVYLYQEACIMRNDDTFFLEVSDVDYVPEVDEIVTVTGEVLGTVYWTQDNKRVEVLDVKASKIESMEEKEVEVNEGPTVTVETAYTKGTFEFLGAHYASDSFGDVVVIYFDFTNDSSSEAAPMLGKFYIYHGDDKMSSTNFSISEVDPGALPANGVGIAEKTPVGKKQRYYMAFKAGSDLEAPIFIEMYDDEFDMTDQVVMDVAASLEELSA